MTIEELEKQNKALREENARLTYSITELLKKLDEYRAALEIKEQNDIKQQFISQSSALVQKLMKTVADLPISVRSKNVLNAAGCETLGDIVKMHKTDFLKFRNCGMKSLTELSEQVELAGLTWGMDVDGIIEAEMKEYLDKKVSTKITTRRTEAWSCVNSDDE